MSSQLKVNAISDAAGANGNAITLATDGTCTAKVTNRSSNLIINGSCVVAQRGTSSTTNGYGSVDRFYVGSSGTNETPTQAQADVASGTTPYTKGFRKSLKITNGNQTSGAGAADYIFINYPIEAQDLATSGWNYVSTSSYVTLSFWIKSSVAQNFYFQFDVRDGTRKAYAMETGSLTADTWTKVTKIIPGNSNLTIDNDNGVGAYLTFGVFWGTNYTASMSLNTWATASDSSKTPDNTSTWYTTNDATYEITGVQLTATDYCPDYPHRSYTDEYNRCLRYFWMIANGSESAAGSGGDGLAPICTGSAYTSSSVFGIIPFPTRMRAAPSIYKVTGTDYWDVVQNNGNTQANDVTINRSSTTSVSLYFSSSLSVTANYTCHVRTYVSSARLGVNAEL